MRIQVGLASTVAVLALTVILIWPVFQNPREGRRQLAPKYRVLREDGHFLERSGRPLEAAQRYEASLSIRSDARLRYDLFNLYLRNRCERDARRTLLDLIRDPNTPKELAAAHLVRISGLGIEASMKSDVETMVDAALTGLTPHRRQLHLEGIGAPDISTEVDMKGKSINPFPLVEWSENLNSKRAALHVAAALQYLHSMNYWDALSLCRNAITMDPAQAKTARIYAAYCVSQLPNRKPAELEGYLAGIEAKDPNLKQCLSIIRREAAKFAMR